MTKTAGTQSPLLREHTNRIFHGLSDQDKSEVFEQLFRVIVQQQQFLDATRKIAERTKGIRSPRGGVSSGKLGGPTTFFPNFDFTGVSCEVWESRHGAFAGVSDDHLIHGLLSEILKTQSPASYHPRHALHVMVSAPDQPTHLVHVADTSPDPGDAERLALLRQAAREGATKVDPNREFEFAITTQAIELLGGARVLGRTIRREEELVAALVAGFPGAALIALQEAGYPHKVLEQVVAPKRTLMRRRADGERLTRSESDAVWRLAYALAMASAVLNGKRAALAWLMRPKPAFSDATPIDLLETSVGAEQVNRLLRQLEWGDVA